MILTATFFHPNWIATAYDRQDFPGSTAAGHPVRVGIAAVDPRIIPLGRYFCVTSHKGGPKDFIHDKRDELYLADDTGGDIKGRRLDLFYDRRDDALAWGAWPVTVKVLAPGEKTCSPKPKSKASIRNVRHARNGASSPSLIQILLSSIAKSVHNGLGRLPRQLRSDRRAEACYRSVE